MENNISKKLQQFEFFHQIKNCLEDCSRSILEIYNQKDHSVSYKNDSSPLTEADLISHKLIEDCLGSISPYPIISEESVIRHSLKNKYWLIDPLDGTKEFLKRNGDFTINIALIENRYPVLGYVYSPIKKALYVGGLERGSIKISNENINGLLVSEKKDPIRVLTSRNNFNEETKNFLTQFKNYELLQIGSSIKFCMVAEGSADIYPRFAPTSEWDTAAAQAIVEGAGGSVQDLNGQRLIYQKENIINPFFVVRGKE